MLTILGDRVYKETNGTVQSEFIIIETVEIC